MKNKYIIRNMRNKLSKSNSRMKSVLFLFLGLLFSITVKSQNCPIIDSANVTNVSCVENPQVNDGVIALVLFPGLIPEDYDFIWNTVPTSTPLITLPPDTVADGLAAGTYTVTITEILDPNCFQELSFIITEPQDPLSTEANLYSDVDCYGDSSGIAYAESAIGGTFPYTYSWNTTPVQNTQLAVNLWGDASFTVTVTDANGCTAESSIDIVNSYPEITGTVNILDHVSCFGECDADVEFSAFGGQVPHAYTWDVGQVYYGSSGPDTAFNLCYGGHNVLVEDAIGCQKIITFTITQPDELLASAIGNGAPIPGQLPTQPVQCFGFNDGTAFASATQGTLGYTFVWDSINGPTGQNIDSLTPGVHTVYVTDTNGCTAFDTVLITEPTKLVVEIDSSLAIYAYCSNTFSGELCAIASGGTPNYAYAWNDVILQTTACAFNLQPDQYTITVMDERNCIAQASFDLDSITNSMNPDSVIITQDSVTCFGLPDGVLTATNVVGGVPPYSYNWTGPPVYTGFGNSINTLYFGSYALVIEDDNGCEITIGTYLDQPDQLEYDIYNTVDATCLGSENGQIWVHVNGGTGQYYYDVLEANTFPIINQIPIINDSLIFNLATGTHSIYITDDNNCEGAVTFGTGNQGYQRDINALLSIPVPIVDFNNTTCYNTNNGTGEVDSPDSLFTYTWENDFFGNPSGLDVSNGAGTYFGSFSPGNYWLVAHYADSASFGIPYYGCDNSSPFTISSGTNPINVVATITDISCYSDNNGQIDLIINGGALGTYDLSWDTTSVYPSGLDTINVSGLYTLANLTVGAYAVAITDSDGCITIEDYEVTEPSPLISDIIPTHVTCFDFSDGSAQVVAVTGTGTLIYVWNTVPITSSISTTSLANNLFAGTYTVTVTDDQLCTYTDTVIILQPTAPIASVEVDSLYYGSYDVRCFGESNAAAIATGSGISFEWFEYNNNTQTIINPSTPVSTDQHTDSILGAGFYLVISEDVNECVDTSEILEIIDPPLLIISVQDSIHSSTYQISCFDANDGWAEVEIQGGVENNNVFGYDIFWSNSVGNEIIGDTIADNLSAGFSYTVNVNDANGCYDVASTILYTEPIEFIANVTTINYAGPFHAPKNISFIDSTISVESYGFEWIWQNGLPEYRNGVNQIDNQVFIHEFLEDELGTNYVFVMLTNEVTGCQDSVEFIIEVQGMPEVNNVFTPNQDGINDEFLFSEYAMGIVDVQIFNRWGQLVYTWVGSDKSWKGIGIDGKDLPEAVYFYVFEGKGVDGHYYDKKGSVTLLR